MVRTINRKFPAYLSPTNRQYRYNPQGGIWHGCVVENKPRKINAQSAKEKPPTFRLA